MNRFFENREATREERNQNIILQMELEKETAIKEKRGVYFHKVNDEDLAEPVSIFEHGKLKKKIILPSNNRAEYVSMHEGPSKKIKSNLENYSSTNQRSILNQKPEATYVLGEERWQLKNRRIKESEKDKPILLIGLKKEGEESFCFEKRRFMIILRQKRFLFDTRSDNYEKEREELRSLVTDKHYKQMRESVLTAYYTDPMIIKTMYQKVQAFGFTGGKILDI